MKIGGVRHDWPEKAGFVIDRPNGYPEYTFLHFMTEVELLVDGQPRTVPPGSCIFYESGFPHWYHAEKPLLHNWFHVDDLAAELTRYNIPVNTLLLPKETAFISKLVQKLEQESFSDSPYREQMITHTIHEFLITFSRALQGIGNDVNVRHNEKEILRDLRHFVLSQPERQWTVAQMAQRASMCQSRFHVVYKAMFGTSPMKDLVDARIRYAQTLLLTRSELSLPEIAEMLGYTNQYHFIRQFRQLTGTTPGAYRKQETH